MGSSTAKDSPHSVLAIGFVLGCAFSSEDGLISFKSLVNWLLVPLYAFSSSVFLLHLVFQTRESETDGNAVISKLRRSISGRGFDSQFTGRGTTAAGEQSLQEPPIPAVTPKPFPDAADRAAAPTDGSQPVDLTGTYKLLKNEGFDTFLAAQGVPWALRKAVDRAQPVHHVTHAGDDLRIKITGIITSESTFKIGGPPVQTEIRGRVFLDTVTYLESSDGIRVHKDNRKDRYKIVVTRQLTPDRTHMVMRSRATFDDEGKESVEAKQTFIRI